MPVNTTTFFLLILILLKKQSFSFLPKSKRMKNNLEYELKMIYKIYVRVFFVL